MIWMMRNAWKGDHTTKETPPPPPPACFRTVVWVFMSPSTLADKRRMKETRPKFYVTAQWRDHLNWAEPSWSHQCFLRPWLLVQPGSDPATSLSAYRCSPNWANRTAWSRRASAFIFFAMESATLSASLQLDRRLQSESVVSGRHKVT